MLELLRGGGGGAGAGQGRGDFFGGEKGKLESEWKVNDLAFSTIGKCCDISVLQSKNLYI
jgi:hypothetical protein